MEPTAPQNHNNNCLRAGGLLMTGAFVFLAVVFVVHVLSPSPPTPEPVKERTAETEPRRVHRTPPPVFDTETYYRTIIDNNLFRPLGWTPPRPTEPYRLLGTLLPRRANTPPQAIIQSTAGNKTYIVTTGETLDASTEVVSIEGKSVTLSTDGQQRTLHLDTGVYLNPSPATRSPRRSPALPHRQTPPPRPARVRSQATPAPPAVSAPQPRDRYRSPLSEWETREGKRIRVGDARLKNPQKWGLRRR